MPFPRQVKWKPKRRSLARVSGISLHCQAGSLLCPVSGSWLGHTEQAPLHVLALSCSQLISFLWNKPWVCFWRQVGCSGFGSFHTVQFFSSALCESSNALLQRRDLTIGKLLPKGGETLPQPRAGTSCSDSELLLLTQKLFWQSGNLNPLPARKAKLKCQHKSEHRNREQEHACDAREEVRLFICLDQFPCLKQTPPGSTLLSTNFRGIYLLLQLILSEGCLAKVLPLLGMCADRRVTACIHIRECFWHSATAPLV